MDQKLISKLIELEDQIVPTLFKPVQFNILKKLDKNTKLTENEKRYLRGKMRDKLNLLGKILNAKKQNEDYMQFLASLGSYYITGLEALKHNGYGWYFKPKLIEVINTKITGKLVVGNITLKLIRVKSITNAEIAIDSDTGLKYAENEQIFNDIKITKNRYSLTVWKQMLSRYKKLFVKNIDKYSGYFVQERITDYSKYGV